MSSITGQVGLAAEQHSADWSHRIEPRSAGGWMVFFANEPIETCTTRELARTQIRAYKQDPNLVLLKKLLDE